MNPNVSRSLLSGVVILTLAACNQMAPAPQEDSSTQHAAAEQVNASLDEMARLFAKAVTNRGLREEIHAGVATRFDGDTNVLYKTLANAPGVHDSLTEARTEELNTQATDAVKPLDALARDIPRFQIAVPSKFDAWDATTDIPLVAFMPEGVDDTELKTITAYDAEGQVYELDAQQEPDQAVIVLGVNERTDDAGQLLDFPESSEHEDLTLSPQATYQVRLLKAHLHDDQEPWPKGDAETMLIAKGQGLWFHDEITYLDDSKDILYLNKVLGSTSNGVRFFWYESDGGTYNVGVSVKGVSLGVNIADGDDIIGGYYMRNRFFAGTTSDKHGFGELTQWTD